MRVNVECREIVRKIEGRLGLITLDRPKALNALNVEMVETLDEILEDWAFNPLIDAVLVRSSSARAFCAGGDVRSIGTLSDATERCALGRRFFNAEYRMNYRINRFPKPFIALLDGVAMGGGLGLSVHGSHRVVSETVRIAMPETILGLFPDVGATWFFSRSPGAIGRYLALVGTHLDTADALAAGLATHHVPAAKFNTLTAALIAAPELDHAGVDAILAGFVRPVEESVLAQRASLIDEIFAADSLRFVIDRIAALAPAAPWAAEVQATLRRASPTSLCITWARMLAGKGQAIDQVLRDDFRLAVRIVGQHDFPEGVRAILIEKDQNAHWSPASIDEVNERKIAALFAPLEKDLELPEGL
ncbi:enoyl-CoA hydratase/isomerase family protein [Acidocella aminolytica]|uniref:3-hydroxyisobutyryl-CoA hydrolase/enoyl-CoA hydratase n=1 Tax=Acidocella aminolytica 101 = DSM 11237 TaxID=1120923 RepID=A0A0D6PK29_9PROT|nr:enoyl-CoA hydratase/isomerase family protein [Acidocella aminolytica]GAN81568.1 3-hydroxyisobutyryl-CoA hydrolase/enoyl-CoA hydratase [Acidocella aminolytica 101 = DSM 11237]GBQ36023.1 enoyl-CoA hydratase [Acidocella aminolytica 101 = DSM 11237]SHF47844.1 enoyl-CoA hydratase [Acidocella aminolytica 101 = DSM 11237]